MRRRSRDAKGLATGKSDEKGRKARAKTEGRKKKEKEEDAPIVLLSRESETAESWAQRADLGMRTAVSKSPMTASVMERLAKSTQTKTLLDLRSR